MVESVTTTEASTAETTLPGARIGEHPYAALARLGNAERVEGTYVPTNSSGAPAVTVVEVAVLDDGTRVMADAARVASGRPFSAWASPASAPSGPNRTRIPWTWFHRPLPAGPTETTRYCPPKPPRQGWNQSLPRTM
jgi:hypothetical protein